MTLASILLIATLGTAEMPAAPAETLRYTVELGGGRIGGIVSVTQPAGENEIVRSDRAEMRLAREGQVIDFVETMTSREDREGRLLHLEVVRIGMGPARWFDSVDRIAAGWRRFRDRGGLPQVDTLAAADLFGPVSIDHLLASGIDSVRFEDLDPIEIAPRQVLARRLTDEAIGEGPYRVVCRVYQLTDSAGTENVRQWRDAVGNLWREEEQTIGWVVERAELSIPREIVPFEAMDLGRLEFEGSVPIDGPCTLLLIPAEDDPDTSRPPPIPACEGQEIVRDDVPGRWRIEISPQALPEATDADREGWASDPALAPALESDLIVDSAAPEIVRFARAVVGEATDPTGEVLLMEKAVHDAIEVVDLKTVFATASQTLAHRSGDCTEHAILLAACCRARGIPARLVAGIVPYRDRMGFHLWTEVYLGSWVGLDAVLGLGRAASCAVAIQRWEQPEEAIGDFSRVLGNLLGRYRFRALDHE